MKAYPNSVPSCPCSASCCCCSRYQARVKALELEKELYRVRLRCLRSLVRRHLNLTKSLASSFQSSFDNHDRDFHDLAELSRGVNLLDFVDEV